MQNEGQVKSVNKEDKGLMRNIKVFFLKRQSIKTGKRRSLRREEPDQE